MKTAVEAVRRNGTAVFEKGVGVGGQNPARWPGPLNPSQEIFVFQSEALSLFSASLSDVVETLSQNQTPAAPCCPKPGPFKSVSSLFC